MTRRRGPNLREHLEWLMPNSSVLIDPDARAKLFRLSESMPAVPRTAFECRLGESATQVDLQQCFCRGEDYRRLALHFQATAPSYTRETAALTATFFEELALEGSALNRGIDELFLEFDLPDTADEISKLPSIFVGFNLEDPLPKRLSTARAALEMLGLSCGAELDKCFAACAGRVHIAHIGFMLSRPGSPVRVNFKGLRSTELRPLLNACGWAGDGAHAESRFEWALARANRVTAALDIGDHGSDHIGFECFIDEQPPREHAWAKIARELCTQGLCSSEKADALLAIPCQVAPSDLPRRWPAELVAMSLSRSLSDLSMYTRLLTHFKINAGPDGSGEAKAYFAATHTWSSGQSEAAQPQFVSEVVTAASPPRTRDVAALASAINRAIDFLIRSQTQSDLWKDFAFAMGTSDEWVSAFVGCQLAETGEPRAVTAARNALSRIAQRQRKCGGWGYHGTWWPDADSTAWVLRLCVALSAYTESFERGTAFLAQHLVNGGVATYAPKSIPTSEVQCHQGWMQPHDCVTGAAAPFVLSASNWLRQRQRSSGAWGSYWWQHEAYSTALALDALRAQPSVGDKARVAAACDAARAWLGEGPSEATAFDVAWCVRILRAEAFADSSLHTAVGHLLSLQATDGSWPAGARLRVPPGNCMYPDGVVCSGSLDVRANFTTAAVLGALAKVAA